MPPNQSKEFFNVVGMPKFSSPEEEIAFLRKEVEDREKALVERGMEANREQIASETIKSYAERPAKEVISRSARMPEKETEAIVLRLRPESHDTTMEELLGVLIDKGIKNTLSVVERLGNPHIDDDFHRFLVQYVHSGTVPGLKENAPIFEALHMKLFEITLPGKDKEDSRGFKELVSAMEQFYAGMQSLARDRRNKDHKYFTLELAVSNTGEELVVYASVPENAGDLLEKQILSAYADAKIREVSDDYNIFNELGSARGAVAELTGVEAFPLKTADAFEHDPMNALLTVFSKLKKDGEGAAVQFVIAPAGDAYVQKYQIILQEIKEGLSVKKALSAFGHIPRELGAAAKELIFGPKSEAEKEKQKKIDDQAVEKITTKMKSSIMTVGIRAIASAETNERAGQILRDVESAFHQFTEAGSNGLQFEEASGNKLADLFHNFSYRMLIEKELMPLSLKETAAIFHLPFGVTSAPELKEAKAGIAPAPVEMNADGDGVMLGINEYRGTKKEIRMQKEDRVRHFYVIGQTGTGKTNILKNMIIQDIQNGEGVCFIDPHGSDIEDILANIPRERVDDVIYFDPAYTARPMGLNMLEYDARFPEQKTFVVNELLAIFNKLFDMKVAGGPAFEQYFRNSALLVMEDPESGSTLLEIGRVLGDKEFRDLKLSKCKNPIIRQFWENAEKTSGEQSLANFVPYITNKFDVFISNDIMRPIISQQESVFNFRKVMDEKKILLVNLSKGRLGDINANLIGLILVGKIQMAALSRVDIPMAERNDFYLYIDEFQNVTTDSIASILSEARKYRLSLNIAHQYIAQLEESIKEAVFGNVGSMAVFRVGPDDAEYLQKQFEPTFTSSDIIKLDNFNAYVKMLIRGTPAKPFNIRTLKSPEGIPDLAPHIKELSYLKYGRERAEVEEEILARYRKI